MDLSEEETASSSHEEYVVLNISGMRFETAERTLANFPNTLLGDPARRKLYHHPTRDEIFFDRHCETFPAILHYYQSGGMLKRPGHVPFIVFRNELEFFDLGEEAMGAFLEEEGLSVAKEFQLPREGWKHRLWIFLEKPDSSYVAYLFSLVSLAIVLLSVTAYCVNRCTQNDPFFVVECVCVIWFTLELGAYYICSPNKLRFFQNAMNIIDMASILPFYIQLIFLLITNRNKSYISLLQGLSLVRVLRVLKLSRHFCGLRVLGKTLMSSFREILVLIVFLFIGVIIFASLVYYTELNRGDTPLESIPEAFWWAVVTMTTVGYGDITPLTPMGKFVGSLCAISGVLVVALPVPFVVQNFKFHYEAERRMHENKIHTNQRSVVGSNENTSCLKKVATIVSSFHQLHNSRNTWSLVVTLQAGQWSLYVLVYSPILLPPLSRYSDPLYSRLHAFFQKLPPYYTSIIEPVYSPQLFYSLLFPCMEPLSRGCSVSLFPPGLQASSSPPSLVIPNSVP
uniref:Potassium voltage-gated channel, shaker-related subfamily, member 4 n=1 Tax=Eptatretus burgeri TaxID=7764 RepID=A0A8C4WSJ9_EPTBU